MSDERDELFSDVDIISCYSRAQAIEDGDLVDLTELAKDQGLKFPTACTRSVFEELCARTDPQTIENVKEMLHMLVMAIQVRMSLGKDIGDTLTWKFTIPQDRFGRKHTCEFKSVIGPGDTMDPVITIMQLLED